MKKEEKILLIYHGIVPFDGLSNIETVRNMFEEDFIVSNIFESIVPSGVSVYFKCYSRFEREDSNIFV